MFADLAHLVEQHPRNVQVVGSSPTIGFQTFVGLEPTNGVSADQVGGRAAQEGGGSERRRPEGADRKSATGGVGSSPTIGSIFI